MAFTPPPLYVPNDPQDLAKNLRFTDPRTGLQVTRQFPWDYQNTIGGSLSQQIDTINTVIANLASTNTVVSNQQAQINNILTSGFALPTVNSACLSSGTNLPLDVVTGLLVANSCSYNTVLGQPSSLYQSIAAQGSNLNGSPAFSQSGSMTGLIGWKSQPLTVADTINNQWISYLDVRAGVSTALAAITPSCGSLIINYSVVVLSGVFFNIYFSGYTFIPAGFTDAGSTLQITDTSGNIYLQAVNVVAQSHTSGPIIIATSGTTLSPTSATYTVTLNSNINNLALAVTCVRTTIQTVINTTQGGGGESSCCPDIGTYSATFTSGSTAIPIVTGLSYTPRYISYQGLDSYTTATVLTHGSFITYSLGGGTLVLSTTTASGTVNIKWIAYR